MIYINGHDLTIEQVIAVSREGETVDGMKILEIHPTRVKLSYDGKSFNAGMFE